MSDSFEFTLNSPLTEEDWNKIADAEFANTDRVWFATPSGKRVDFIKADVLDRIRAEIEQEYKVESEHPYGQGLRRALEITNKYKTESEE
jgi:hypothetical protein